MPTQAATKQDKVMQFPENDPADNIIRGESVAS